jgi:hypothetical protein
MSIQTHCTLTVIQRVRSRTRCPRCSRWNGGRVVTTTCTAQYNKRRHLQVVAVFILPTCWKRINRDTTITVSRAHVDSISRWDRAVRTVTHPVCRQQQLVQHAHGHVVANTVRLRLRQLPHVCTLSAGECRRDDNQCRRRTTTPTEQRTGHLVHAQFWLRSTAYYEMIQRYIWSLLSTDTQLYLMCELRV